MPMFHMFLSSPPESTPVASVFREKRPFGPYVLDGALGFSVGIEMGIAETAPAGFRSVRTCCAGQLQIVGVQAGGDPTDPDAPLIVALEPQELEVVNLLKNVGLKAEFEPPLAFIYVGLDPASLKENLMPVINALAYLSVIGQILTPEERWENFREGHLPLPVPGNFVLAEVSNKNLSEGFRSVGFAARTNWMQVSDVISDPLNFLDPVRLYQRLITEKLGDGTDVVPPGEAQNSWLEVATKNRILFTLRDEWNAPIIDGTDALVTDGTQQVTIPLTIDRQGTFLAPAGMNRYTISIAGRKLTRISKPGSVSSNEENLSTAAPAHHVIGSVRPEDWFHPQHPTLTDPTKELRLYTENNVARALIDGRDSFLQIVFDLRKINQPDNFFLFTNWWTEHTFELITGDTGSTLKKLMENINAVGAPVRALIWRHFAGTGLPFVGFNVPAHNFISDLTHGQSVLDSRTHHAWIPLPPLAFAIDQLRYLDSIGVATLAMDAFGFSGPNHMGAHHSKTCIIRNRDETVAYIGGIDFNPNRLDDPFHPFTGTRFHDVHSRIAGPAAEDLTKAFVDRWSDHPENQLTSRRLRIAPRSTCPAGETCIEPVPATPSADATCMVQIARTFGATTLSYAPDGDRTAWATLKQALGRARKYIYVEDQYLVSPELSAELLAALPRIEHLIIVMDHNGESFLPGRLLMERARYLFLKPLRDLNTQKVHVFTLVKDGSPYKVHTKVVIVDDVFATIGSANMNRRGFTHDTESNAFFLDGRVIDGARKFARELRTRLWAEHLGWDLRSHERLFNIDRAIEIFLRNRPVTARLQPYDYSRGEGSGQLPGWNQIIDPDGTLAPASS